MGQYRLDDHRIFDTGNHLGGATADPTGFHINVEYPLEPLRPRHCHMALRGCFLILLVCDFLTALAPLGWCHPCSVFAVRGDKIAGSDFEQPKAGPKGGGQDARSNITWVVPITVWHFQLASSLALIRQ